MACITSQELIQAWAWDTQELPWDAALHGWERAALHAALDKLTGSQSGVAGEHPSTI